jgi:hypothetical protein
MASKWGGGAVEEALGIDACSQLQRREKNGGPESGAHPRKPTPRSSRMHPSGGQSTSSSARSCEQSLRVVKSRGYSDVYTYLTLVAEAPLTLESGGAEWRDVDVSNLDAVYGCYRDAFRATAVPVASPEEGDRALSETFRVLHRMGASSVQLDVESTNRPALDLYDRWGFRRVGQEEAFRIALPRNDLAGGPAVEPGAGEGSEN